MGPLSAIGPLEPLSASQKAVLRGDGGEDDRGTTHLAYATPEGFHTLLSSALFLPEDWSNDRERCRRAGIPEDLVYRPKWRIALELHQEARPTAYAWPSSRPTNFMAVPVEFHLELSRRGQQYVLEVPRNFWGWCRQPELLHKAHHGAVRRRLKRQNPLISTVENLVAHSPIFRQQTWIWNNKDLATATILLSAEIGAFGGSLNVFQYCWTLYGRRPTQQISTCTRHCAMFCTYYGTYLDMKSR
ncbi:MAG: transposase [Phycisphaerae bacterium]